MSWISLTIYVFIRWPFLCVCARARVSVYVFSVCFSNIVRVVFIFIYFFSAGDLKTVNYNISEAGFSYSRSRRRRRRHRQSLCDLTSSPRGFSSFTHRETLVSTRFTRFFFSYYTYVQLQWTGKPIHKRFPRAGDVLFVQLKRFRSVNM